MTKKEKRNKLKVILAVRDFFLIMNRQQREKVEEDFCKDVENLFNKGKV